MKIKTCLIALVVLACSFTVYAESPREDISQEIEQLYATMQDSEILSEWAVISLVKAGVEFDKQKHIDYYLDKAAQTGKRTSVTDYAKLAMCLSSLGVDCANIKTESGKINLYSVIANADSSLMLSPISYAYALRALTEVNYAFPYDASNSAEKYIDAIAEGQLEGGGFSFTGEDFDPDATSLVLIALAPYCAIESHPLYAKASAIADKCVELLSQTQTSGGGFMSWGSENSNTAATVISALSALGVDSASDERFVKDASLLDNLLTFKAEGGGFGYMDNSAADDYSNEQALMALCDYYAYLSGERYYPQYFDIGKALPTTLNAIKTARQKGVALGSEGKLYPNEYVRMTDYVLMLLRYMDIFEGTGYYDLCKHLNFYHITLSEGGENEYKKQVTKSIMELNLDNISLSANIYMENLEANFGSAFMESFKKRHNFDVNDYMRRDIVITAIIEFFAEQEMRDAANR